MSSEETPASDSSIITPQSSIPCRLIIDPPQPGAWNMAVDEALLESAINDGVATLRFYQWSEPTLSLGYFQKHADRELHAASRGCPLVRRHSGGGAILHDQEVTYSLALPPDAELVRDPEQIYRRTHEALLAVLADWSPDLAQSDAAKLCEAAIKPPQGAEPFLCFQRRARCDVLLPAGEQIPETVDGRHKVCGSAQRKRRGGVLQHGSLLLRRSEAAPELPGVCDIADQPFEAEACIADWASRIAEQLGFDLSSDQLRQHETQLANQLAKTQFSDPAWIQRR